MAYQQNYARYQSALWPGMRARPGEPWIVDQLPFYNASASAYVQPGDPVLYDRTNNAFVLPTSVAQVRQCVGVVVAPRATLPTTGLAVDDDGNSDAGIRYTTGNTITVCVLGTVAVQAGAAAEYGDIMEYQTGDRKWDVRGNVAAIADVPYVPFICVSPAAVADGDIMELRVGVGRIK